MKEELLNRLKDKYLEEKSKKDLLLKQLEDLKNELQNLTDQRLSESIQKELVLKASEEARAAGKNTMETLCTKALAEIDPTLSVEVETSVKASSPCVDVVLKRTTNGETVLTDPAEEDAGGIADLVALSAFLSLNILNDTNSAPLFLDETTKFVSRDNSNNVAKFFDGVSKNVNKQLFILTHESELPEYATNHFVLNKDADGITRVTSIKNR